jgi:late competence protein required for DNA uptake (superfamily II DNA/RNA helicase)
MSGWIYHGSGQELYRITKSAVRCARCKETVAYDGFLQLPEGHLFCQYCVREALVRMTAELEDKP